jgi:teichuronic acid biosynthesis glycosyltransferase TuaG
MQNSPMVSIIIPNYNTELYLGETIDSVIAQSYTNWELLIIDDHSTDKSLEIINGYVNSNDKIKLLMTPENSGGPATPRNIGIDNAKGEYIAFLDSDDTWLLERLNFHMNFMLRENSKFSSTFRNTFSNPAEMKTEIIESRDLKVYSYNDLLRKNLIDTSAVIIHKSIIGDIRFDTSTKFIAIEDYVFWLEILKKHNEKILVSEVDTINYRITGENISRSKVKMAKKFIDVISHFESSVFLIAYYFINYSILSIIYLKKKR